MQKRLKAPTFNERETIDSIHRQEIRFILEPLGPSKFVVKEFGTKKKFTVSIGAQQECSCHSREICVHIFYVMMRYFGVPPDMDVLWQRSLTEREIDMLLNGRITKKPTPKKQPLYQTKSGKKKVKRLPITDEDVCPICYEELKGCDPKKIAWCRCGCGGNFHRSCVKEWIASRQAYGEGPTCPMCREPLDLLGLKAPPPKPVNSKPNLTEQEIQDLMRRDLSPDDYDLLLRLDQPGPMPAVQHRTAQRRTPQEIKHRNPVPQQPDIGLFLGSRQSSVQTEKRPLPTTDHDKVRKAMWFGTGVDPRKPPLKRPVPQRRQPPSQTRTKKRDTIDNPFGSDFCLTGIDLL